MNEGPRLTTPCAHCGEKPLCYDGRWRVDDYGEYYERTCPICGGVERCRVTGTRKGGMNSKGIAAIIEMAKACAAGERMRLVYIVGPFRADSAWGIEQNIRQAEALALKCWRAGVAVICPHANTRYFQGAAPDDVPIVTWLRGDLEMLRRCDAIVLTPDWGGSIGAQAELALAKEIGLEVFHSSMGEVPAELSGWAKGAV